MTIRRKIADFRDTKNTRPLSAEEVVELKNLHNQLEEINRTRISAENDKKRAEQNTVNPLKVTTAIQSTTQTTNSMSEKFPTPPQETATAMPESASTEHAPEVEPTPTKNEAWQDEAISRFESEGGKILDAELEERPVSAPAEVVEDEEVVSAPVPVITEKNWDMSETIFPDINITQPEKVPAQSSTRTLEHAQKVETAEEKKERILGAIYKFHNVELPERAKKAGISENMLDVLRAGGEVYKGLPLKKKLLISLALFGTAWIAGGTIASIAMGGSLTQRALGGMATFVATEGVLKASAEKDGRERGEWEKRRHTAEALIAGFIVGGGVVGQGFKNIFSLATDYIPALHDPVNVSIAPIAPQIEYVATACPGDSRWSLVARALADGPFKNEFAKMGYNQQTYVIDALKDRLTSGMTDEVANTLDVGESIDFKDVFNDKDFMEKAFSGAKGLTSAQVANIENYTPDAPTSTHAPTDVEFKNHEMLMDSTTPAIGDSAAIHQDTLIKTIITEEGRKVPIMEYHIPVETVTHNVEGKDVPTLETNVYKETAPVSPVETPAVAHDAILDNVDTAQHAPSANSVAEGAIDRTAEALANVHVHDKVNDVFGIKFFGFTIEDGMKNADWLNFANRSVDEVYNAQPHATVRGDFLAEANASGMGNNQAINKMQNLIFDEVKRTNTKWVGGETIDQFLHRVALIKTTVTITPANPPYTPVFNQ